MATHGKTIAMDCTMAMGTMIGKVEAGICDMVTCINLFESGKISGVDND